MQTDPSIDFNMGFVAEEKSTLIQSLKIHFLKLFLDNSTYITYSNVLVYLCGYRGLISKKIPFATTMYIYVACCMHTNFVRISNKHYSSRMLLLG